MFKKPKLSSNKLMSVKPCGTAAQDFIFFCVLPRREEKNSVSLPLSFCIPGPRVLIEAADPWVQQQEESKVAFNNLIKKK